MYGAVLSLLILLIPGLCALAAVCVQLRRLIKARSDLFHVGGPLAKELSRHGVALMINNTLFAHGGVLPHHGEPSDSRAG